MVTVHHVVAVLVILVSATAAAWGGLAYWRRREPGRLLVHVITLGQTLLIAQVGLGLLLLSDHHRAAHQLHYAYGVLALGTALSPWLYAPSGPRARLAWFSGASLLAALLAIRAYMTA